MDNVNWQHAMIKGKTFESRISATKQYHAYYIKRKTKCQCGKQNIDICNTIESRKVMESPDYSYRYTCSWCGWKYYIVYGEHIKELKQRIDNDFIMFQKRLKDIYL